MGASAEVACDAGVLNRTDDKGSLGQGRVPRVGVVPGELPQPCPFFEDGCRTCVEVGDNRCEGVVIGVGSAEHQVVSGAHRDGDGTRVCELQCTGTRRFDGRICGGGSGCDGEQAVGVCSGSRVTQNTSGGADT